LFFLNIINKNDIWVYYNNKKKKDLRKKKIISFMLILTRDIKNLSKIIIQIRNNKLHFIKYWSNLLNLLLLKIQQL
jgi:hypothetical protein